MLRYLISLVMAIGITTSAYADTPYRIGTTAGLTGKYANLAAMQANGYKMWERDVNSKGGIMGRPVQLVILDDKSDPKVAHELFKTFIEKEKVDYVFAPYSSELTAAIVDLTEKYHYPMLAPGAAAASLWQNGYQNLFGVSNPTDNYTVGFLELLVREGVKTIATLNADDVFSRSANEATQTWARRFNLQVVYSVEFKKSADTNLEPLINKAATTKADVLMMHGHYEEAVNARRALKKIGWKPRAFYSTIGPLLPKYGEVLQGDANGTFSSSQWEPNSYYPGARNFAEQFSKTYGQAPSYHAANAYASGQILEAAVQAQKSFDREKLREGLATLDTWTVAGRYGVDHTGKQIRQLTTIVQWQNGQKKIVAPAELKSALPIWN